MSAFSEFWVPDVKAPGLPERHPLRELELEILDQEDKVRVRPGTPILLDPEGCVDQTTVAYFNSLSFSPKKHTRESAASDSKLWMGFLHGRGKSLRDATEADLEDYALLRLGFEDDLLGVAGRTWNRQLSSLDRLHTWMVDHGYAEVAPIARTVRTLLDGSAYSSINVSAKDHGSNPVKWMSPGSYKVWRDCGLRRKEYVDPRTGEVLEVAQKAKGRAEARNVAFADLLFRTGMRLREGSALLVAEIPAVDATVMVARANVPGGLVKASNQGRAMWIPQTVLRSIAAYVETDRAFAVATAQRKGTYDSTPHKLIVESTTGTGVAVTAKLRDERGRQRTRRLAELSPGQRRRLFIETEEGLEPLLLWLTIGGKPMQRRSWYAPFNEANQALADAGIPCDPCHPHVLRHSFALTNLVYAHALMEDRLSVEHGMAARKMIAAFGDPFTLVQQLLGHSSVETTRDYYLGPSRGVLAAQILRTAHSDLDAFFEQLTASANPADPEAHAFPRAITSGGDGS